MPREPLEIQTLLFERERFTPREACAWARSHGYACHKYDLTDRHVRIRQHAPSEFKPRSFRTVTFGDGVKAVMGHLR